MTALVVVILVFNISLSASAYVLPGREGSTAYRYLLTMQQMQALITAQVDTIDHNVFALAPVDSCPVAQVDTIQSPVGQWLWAWRSGAKLSFRIDNHPPFSMEVFGERKGIIQVRVAALDGATIADAHVALGGKGLKYNPLTSLYEIKAPAGSKLMRINVTYGGYFDSRLCNQPSPFRPRYLDYTYSPYNYNPVRQDKSNRLAMSYMTSDKPLYRPADSLRWKAFVVDGCGRWLSDDMTLAIEGFYSSFRKVIGPVSPSSKGLFWGRIALADSLELRAGERYLLVLSSKKGRVATSFVMEDYELKSLNISTDSPNEVLCGNPYIVTVKSTDEKGDPISSGTATLTLRSGMVSAMRQSRLFVPDTLLQTVVALSSSGTTPIVIDTKQLPQVDEMSVSWTLEVRSDIYEKISRFGSFTLRSESTESNQYHLPQFVSIENYEVADSVGFDVVNPDSIPFRYAIYADSRLVAADYAKVLSWRSAAPKSATYSIFVDKGKEKKSGRIEHRNTDLRVRVSQPHELTPGAGAVISLSVTDSKGRPVSGADVTAFSYTAKFGDRVALPSKWTFKGKKIKDLAPYQISNPVVSLKRMLVTDPDLQRLHRTHSALYYSLLTPTWHEPFVYAQHIGGCKSQIAPFVIADGEIVPAEIVYLDSRPVYIGWATNSAPYSFAVEPGIHRVTIRTAHGQYDINNVSVDENTKMWISVKAMAVSEKYQKTGARHPSKSAAGRSKHESGYTSHSDASSAFYVAATPMPPFLTPTEEEFFRRWSQLEYSVSPRRGIPYLALDDGSVVSLQSRYSTYSTTGVALVPSTAGVYSETALTDSTAIMPWHYIPNGLTTIYPNSRILIADRRCFQSDKGNKRTPLCSTIVPSPDDSLLSTSILAAQWIEEVDNRRRYAYFYHGPEQHGADCSLSIIYPRNAERPINYVVTAGSRQWVYGGGRSVMYGLHPQRYTVSLLYPDSRLISFDITLRRGGRNYLLASDSGAVVTARSLALTDSIRHWTEATMIRSHSDDFSNFSSQEESVSVFAYGSSRRPMYAMKSAAVETADDAVFFEEEIAVDNSAAEGAAIVESLRSDFSDVAYWQPSLRTDRNGQVSFRVTYPDDLTRWNEYFIAAKGRTRGYARTSVVTRHDCVATLAAPRFVVEGDSFGVIGQIVNYTDSPLSVSSQLYLGDRLFADIPQRTVATSSTDRFILPFSHGATHDDSVSVSYLFTNGDLTDGERRDIPVYRRGLMMVDGGFSILDSPDTVIVVSPDTAGGDMSLRLVGDMWSVLLDEVQQNSNKYLSTNDMLASLLMSLLVSEQAAALRGSRFDSKNDVRKLIRTLESNRQSDYMWSWWGSAGRTAPWVSLHVYTALLRAQEAGYQVSCLDSRQSLATHFVMNADYAAAANRYHDVLSFAQIVSLLGFDVETRNLISAIPIDSLDIDSRIVHHTLAARTGLPVSFAAIDTLRHRDLLGGEYYAVSHYHLVPLCAKIFVPQYYSQIETTLLAYRLLAAMPPSVERDARMKAVERWLLRNRRASGWPNPFVSARIVDALLPSVTSSSDGYKPLSVTITSGNGEKVVTSFPVQIDSITSPVSIRKTGASDLYVSHWQRWFDPSPVAHQAELTISTSFDSIFTAGVDADVVVTVTASADAEYVVVRVPIPAGCSYADYQPYSYPETHRENLRHVANIYCENLPAGTYSFRIRLNPRFSGRYTVNPAQVEMIYFPTFNANNTIRQLTID